MSTEPFIGEIKLFGFSFPPRGYMTCAGQILSIAQNTALFSLLGTTYGGNGQTTFGLPNLGGRIAVGAGSSPGTSEYTLGEASGVESTTLLSSNMPQHVHTVNGVRAMMHATAAAEGSDPSGMYPGTAASDFYGPAGNNLFLGPTTLSGTTDIAGGSMPFSILQPFLALNYSIAIVGLFPSRD